MGEAAKNIHRPKNDGRLDKDYRPPVSHLMSFDEFVEPDSLNIAQMTHEWQLKANALKEIWVRQSRDNFSSFMQYCFVDYENQRGFKQQWFHDDWAAAMDKYQRLLIIAPRAHGKTSQVVGRVIWELGKNPNIRIKIPCASDGRAKERLFQIKQNIIYNPRVKEVFPGLQPDEDAEWSAHKIHVRRTALHKDASVEALGILSTATGGRCDLLIPDDVVDRRNALSMPGLRKQIKQAWLSDWSNILDPKGRILGVCTLWHKDDLNHMLMDNKVYKTLFYAVDNVFSSLWPDKWPEEALRLKFDEIKSIEFNRGFRNQPVDMDSQMIRGDWIVFRDLLNDDEFQSRVGSMEFLLSYDPAGKPTGNKEQDFSASVVLAIDVDRAIVYVLDAWCDRLTLKKMSARVKAESRRYFPFRIVIEKVGQSSLDEWVANDYPELAELIVTTSPNENKALRLIGCTPLFEGGQVIFSSHLDPNGQLWVPGKESIIHQLEDAPFAKHDDMTDALSQGLMKAKRYWLDEWASGGDNREVNITIGAKDNDKDKYMF